MCGRIVQRRRGDELVLEFDALAEFDERLPRYNLGPQQDALVVVRRNGHRVIVPHRWGLIPVWAPDPAIANRTFNARIETVAHSPAFKEAYRAQRCLVPVDGFYEWTGQGKARRPYFITPSDGTLLVLAGLWAAWTDRRTGEMLRTFTVITRPADEFMAPLHGRMPAALHREHWSAWLDPSADAAALRSVLADVPLAGEWRAWPVSTRVNSIRNDDPELLEPAPPGPAESSLPEGSPGGRQRRSPALPGQLTLDL